MCGIVGSVGVPKNLHMSYLLMTSLLSETQRRGPHATGHYIVNEDNQVDFFKVGLPSSVYVRLPHWKQVQNIHHKAFIGHARYTTTGPAKDNENNHPFVSPSENIGLIHNGTLYKHHKYCSQYTMESRCDSELLLRIILKRNNIMLGIREIYEKLGSTGDFACLMIYRNSDTNTTKLYFFRDPGRPGRFIDARNVLGQMFFCSTTDIWRDSIINHPQYEQLKQLRVDIIPAFQIWAIDAETLKIQKTRIPIPTYRDLKPNNTNNVIQDWIKVEDDNGEVIWKRPPVVPATRLSDYHFESLIKSGDPTVKETNIADDMLWYHAGDDIASSAECKDIVFGG